MSDYTKTTNFAAKDSLPSGNSGKIVKGSEIDTEFTNIQTAVATKLDINNSALTGTTTAQTLDISGNVDVDGTLETDALSLNGVTVTSTAAELNYVDGVTSNIQTQLNTKAPLASPTFTGAVTAAGLEVESAAPVLEIDSTTSSSLATFQFTSNGTVDSKITHVGNTGVMTIDSGRNSSWGGKIVFVTDTETRMTIDSSGKVLIGTTGTSFNERLTVNSNTAPYSAHLFAGSGATAPLICRNQNGVSGSRSQIIFYYDSSAVGSITSTPSATGYGTSSDQRLKSNIEDADDAGSKVDAIQVRKFDWKVDGSHQDYGMVAQELQSVAPEAVTGDAESDEMMAVDYSKLVPMLVKEIQSLRARVAQLENN